MYAIYNKYNVCRIKKKKKVNFSFVQFGCTKTIIHDYVNRNMYKKKSNYNSNINKKNKILLFVMELITIERCCSFDKKKLR